MNMGMKYPAGMGIVVARISIQNCGWGNPEGHRLEATGHSGQGKDWTGDRGVSQGERMPGPTPSQYLVSGKALSSRRNLALTKSLLCARSSPFFPLNLPFEGGTVTTPF